MTKLLDLELQTVYKGTDCEEYSESTADSPLYECNNCGEVFNRENSANGNHQCPSCNKFASKRAEDSCAECGQSEVTEVMARQCPHCDEWIEDGDETDHLKSCPGTDEEEVSPATGGGN